MDIIRLIVKFKIYVASGHEMNIFEHTDCACQWPQNEHFLAHGMYFFHALPLMYIICS